MRVRHELDVSDFEDHVERQTLAGFLEDLQSFELDG